jgi:hypothetical protein
MIFMPIKQCKVFFLMGQASLSLDVNFFSTLLLSFFIATSFFVPRTGHGAQPSIKSVVKKKEKQEADRVMGRCLFWSDLPLSITKTNPFWQPMCDAIVVVGPGYKSATYEELRGPILQAEKAGHQL